MLPTEILELIGLSVQERKRKTGFKMAAILDFRKNDFSYIDLLIIPMLLSSFKTVVFLFPERSEK